MWLTDGAEGRIGYLDKLWPKIEESGVNVIRIGGNGYNRKMPSIDTLTSWVTNIKAIGAEPLMQVSAFGTAKEAADLVQYFNSKPQTYIKYWSIGNEPYIIDKMPLDSVSMYLKSHASAMKKVDPKIKILAPDLAAYAEEAYEKLLLDDKLGISGRDENGNWYIDGVNFHNYPNAKDYDRSDVIFYSVTKMRGMILKLKRDIALADEKYGRFGEDQLTWGITEFNITYSNPDDLGVDGIAVPSFINGQFWVDVYAMAMEHEAFTVTPWCIQESDRNSTYFGYIGGPPKFTPHSTYYHMQMMSKYMRGEYLKIISNEPYLKVFGAKKNESVSVLMMNQSEGDTYQFDLSDLNKKTYSTDVRLNSEHDLKLNGNVSISPNTTLLMRFNKAGKLIYQERYDLAMATKDHAPKSVAIKK